MSIHFSSKKYDTLYLTVIVAIHLQSFICYMYYCLNCCHAKNQTTVVLSF